MDKIEKLSGNFEVQNFEYEKGILKSVTYICPDLNKDYEKTIKFDIKHKVLELNCYLYSLEELESIIEICKELQLFENN